jgi:GntR family transcriptional repressor for pyruvate dehydrogenase complex
MQSRNPQSLTEEVKETFLDWIRQGQYPPGSRFPSVPQLVGQLGVSRTVIREALQALVGMHLIDMRPGMGSFIRSVPPEMILNADVMASLIDADTMRHVVSARIVLESSVAALAVTEATEEDFEAMNAVVDQIEKAALLQHKVAAITPAFHVEMARATHNPILVSVIKSFNALMAKTGELLEEKAGQSYGKAEYKSHAELLKILRLRDSEGARTAVTAHILQTLDALNEIGRENELD